MIGTITAEKSAIVLRKPSSKPFWDAPNLPNERIRGGLSENKLCKLQIRNAGSNVAICGFVICGSNNFFQVADL